MFYSAFNRHQKTVSKTVLPSFYYRFVNNYKYIGQIHFLKNNNKIKYNYSLDACEIKRFPSERKTGPCISLSEITMFLSLNDITIQMPSQSEISLSVLTNEKQVPF